MIPTGSEDFRKRNPHLFPVEQSLPPEGLKTQLKRIRQSRDELNKLEREWQDKLYRRYPGAPILAQKIRVRLGNGVWYKPDFVVVLAGWWHCYEVKGPKSWRGGFENLKIAASQFQTMIWILAWKDEETKEWQEQHIKP